METEKDRLEREIKVLEKAKQICANHGYAMAQGVHCMTKLEKELAALTRPAIKDGVLGFTYGRNGSTEGIRRCGDVKEWGEGYTFHPLTIEELLPTLAQWVPGAVRWRYVSRDSIGFYGVMQIIENEREDGPFRIPAPPRDDWQEVRGEL